MKLFKPQFITTINKFGIKFSLLFDPSKRSNPDSSVGTCDPDLYRDKLANLS